MPGRQLRSLALLRLLVVLLAASVTLVLADSTSRNPLRLLSAVSHPQIHTGSRRVHAYSSFDLSFSAFDGHRRIKLSLEPNHNIFPEDARVSQLGPDGRISYSEPINRRDFKVYKGIAKQARSDGSWANVGWARLTVSRDGVHPVFEGAFTVDHDAHHIQTRTSYARTRHRLDPIAEEEDDEYMVIWRDSDVSPFASKSIGPAGLEHTDLRRRGLDETLTCSSDSLSFNNDPAHPVNAELLRRRDDHWGVMPVGQLYGKRQIDSQPSNGNQAGVNLVSTIGQTQGCPNTHKVALVGVMMDCSYFSLFNSTQTAREYVITQMNSASAVWESSFNISLGLQNVMNQPRDCPATPVAATEWNQGCTSNLQISDRLNLFSAWRGTLNDTNSHWTLLTDCHSDSAVGLAWLGMACVQTATTSNSTDGSGQETVSGANVVAHTSTEWQVIAHETGHTYGAVHDCYSVTCSQPSVVSSSQCCPLSATQCDAGEQYIMNPSTSPNLKAFSPCSIGNICSAIGRNSVNTTCLSANRGVVTIIGQQCGNGIVEEGEDCDCGGEEACGDNPCCDAKTCRFKAGAVCDDSNEECCSGCQFAAAATVCRPSTGSCDPEETCTGNSSTCPADTTAPDGQSCSLPSGDAVNTTHLDLSALACASGQCTSRDLQCITVMGSYTNGSNDTYACDSNTCTMSCASPAFGPNVCYGLQQNLLDGTPCGGGGHCSQGVCKGSSFGREVQSWVADHKGLVIGIAAGVGGLLLLAILSCVVSRCRRGGGGRRRGHAVSRGKPASPDGSWYSGGNGSGGMPPPVPPHGGGGGGPAVAGGLGQMREHYGWYPPSGPPASPMRPSPPAMMYGGAGYGAGASPSYPSSPYSGGAGGGYGARSGGGGGRGGEAGGMSAAGGGSPGWSPPPPPHHPPPSSFFARQDSGRYA